jgi:hypothetical protein
MSFDPNSHQHTSAAVEEQKQKQRKKKKKKRKEKGREKQKEEEQEQEQEQELNEKSELIVGDVPMGDTCACHVCVFVGRVFHKRIASQEATQTNI